MGSATPTVAPGTADRAGRRAACRARDTGGVQRSTRQLLIIGGAIVVLVAAFFIAKPGDDNDDSSSSVATTAATTATTPAATTSGTSTTTTTTPAPPTPPKPDPGPLLTGSSVESIKVDKGDTVRFRVKAPQDEEVHVHGYDNMYDVRAGVVKAITFKASIDGIFEIEFEHAGTQIAKLTVEP
jgi:hypothetical protein